MIIQEAIRALRKAYGETQQYFATRLKIATGSLAYYEVGVRHPDLRAALLFQRAAEDIGRRDLAKIFSDLGAIELGRFVVQADDVLQFEQLQTVQEVLRAGSVAATGETRERAHRLLMEFFAAMKPTRKRKRSTR